MVSQIQKNEKTTLTTVRASAATSSLPGTLTIQLIDLAHRQAHRHAGKPSSNTHTSTTTKIKTTPCLYNTQQAHHTYEQQRH